MARIADYFFGALCALAAIWALAVGRLEIAVCLALAVGAAIGGEHGTNRTHRHARFHAGGWWL
jgi:hypothetical protein